VDCVASSPHLGVVLPVISLAIAEMDGAKAASLAFRIVALALSVAAAVVMGTANQLMVDSGWGRGVVSYNYKHYSALV
jgi:hypothetical protein